MLSQNLNDIIIFFNGGIDYYEVKNDHDIASKIPIEAIEKANKELTNIEENDNENKDTVSIVNLLRENLEK